MMKRWKRLGKQRGRESAKVGGSVDKQSRSAMTLALALNPNQVGRRA